MTSGGACNDKWHPLPRVVATLALTADRPATDEWWIVQQTLAGVAAKGGGAFNNTERGSHG